MNFGNLLKAFDAAVALRDAAMRFKGGPPPPADPGRAIDAGATGTGLQSTVATGLANQVEARLTNVVVAALKEAFDRDHARLELERSQLDEQRRRAEEAMRMELRRQAAERELGRLRLLAGAALVGWIAAVALLLVRLGTASIASRAIMAAAWLMLLGSFGAGLSAQGRIGADVPAGERGVGHDPAATLALGLLIAGLALAPVSLLF
jgi:hypothetical protein